MTSDSDEAEHLRALLAKKDVALHVVLHELTNQCLKIVQAVGALKKVLTRLPPEERAQLESKIRLVNDAIEGIDDLKEHAGLVEGFDPKPFAYQPTRGDLRDIIERIIRVRESSGASTGSTLTLAPGEPITGSWDARLLGLAVGNLVTNAYKYGQGLPITLTLIPSEESVRVSVRDYGPGIPREDQEPIFGQYARGITQGQRGLGLGLWIAKEATSAHGGTITLQSTLGIGSTFTITLPRTTQRG